MLSCSIQVQADIGPVSIRSSINREAEVHLGMEPDLPAAVTGTITSAGATLGAGHGLTEGKVITIYWSSGRRFGVTVDSVNGCDIVFSSGKGDALPPDGTAILVAVERSLVARFSGAELVALLMSCPSRACVRFMASDESLMLVADLAANEPWAWWNKGSTEDPIGRGIVDILVASQAGLVQQPLKVGFAFQG